MTRLGVDYSAGVPSPAALKAAGFSFVLRYVSTRGARKNVTASEVMALRGAGIDIGVVFETTAARALAGQGAGQADAVSARQQVVEVGGPPDGVIYFAVDFDATEAQQPLLNAYLRGAASVLGRDRTGVYGGYYVVKRALDAEVCAYAWQTAAWSGGQWDPRACLQQYAFGRLIDGIAVDFNRAMADGFGQWDATREDDVSYQDARDAVCDVLHIPRGSQLAVIAGQADNVKAFQVLAGRVSDTYNQVNAVLGAVNQVRATVGDDERVILGAIAALPTRDLSDDDIARLASAIGVADVQKVAEAVRLELAGHLGSTGGTSS